MAAARGRRLLACSLTSLACAVCPGAAAQGSTRDRAADFDALWRAIDARDAYLGRAGRAEWQRAREATRARALAARDRAESIAAIEALLALLGEDSAAVSESTASSPRRIPVESDVWAAWHGPRATIEAVRTFSDADVAGLRPGDVVTHVDGLAIDKAVRALSGRNASREARDAALRRVLAGPRQGTLRLQLADTARHDISIEHAPAAPANGSSLLARRIGEQRDLGYLRVRDGATREAFDGALDELREARALIVDLRGVAGDTPLETIAAYLGRFVGEPRACWQLHESREGARRADALAARANPYRGPVVVLVDRWTAGRGEALAAGLRDAAGAKLVGTPMAGWRGDTESLRLEHSGLTVRFPGRRTLTCDGTPREQLRPDIPVDLTAPNGGPGDPILYQALKALERR